MAKPRKFSPEFKAKIALASLRGDQSMAVLCRKHLLSDSTIDRWRKQLVKQAADIFAGRTPDEAQKQRIDDLERLIGQMTIELNAAKKLSAMLG